MEAANSFSGGKNKLKIVMEILLKIVSGYFPQNLNPGFCFCFLKCQTRYLLKLKNVGTDTLVVFWFKVTGWAGLAFWGNIDM